ncbi:MAG: diguanylate cyclase [Chloroflexota bacterium]
MNRLAYPHYKLYRYIIVAASYAIYVLIFISFHHQAGIGIASLAIIPVIGASWYFGLRDGILMAILSILSNSAVLINEGEPLMTLYRTPGNLIGTFSLIVIALVIGRLSTVTRERREALHKLEQYEKENKSHTNFLELLNQITARALEADSLKLTLDILTEQIAHLFDADDTFLSFWDEAQGVPIPTAAYGSMKDTYPYVQFEPGELTPTTSLMEFKRPIPIMDIEDSPYISPKTAAIFPSRSMLGIPLITQRHKLGAILLGYNEKRTFGSREILQAEITAEQVALVLSKSQLLEEERKQVRRLTALHDVALTAIEVDDEDQLIERVTDIIGQNLFPDNFGILLLDEEMGILRAHPSYRFSTTGNLQMKDMHPGEGITGEVASTGNLQRIGHVRRVQQYVDVDSSTISELCVAIKFKERILGVINAESTKRDAFTTDDERLLVTLAGQLATAIEQLRKAQDERKWLDQLAHSNDLIYSIAQITTQIDRSPTPDEIIHTLGNELRNISLTCIMAVYNEDQKSFTVNYTSLQPRFLAIVETALGYPLIEYSFPRQKLDSTVKTEDMLRPVVISNPDEEIAALFTHIKRPGVAGILKRIGVTHGTEPLRLPLVFEENLLGILWVWGKGINKSDLPVMSIFAKQIGISLERARLFQEVQSLALTDPLTGLQNRRSLFELGRIEFSRAQRMKRSFSCMMLDLDHFKQVNDNHGHQAGDRVLQEFAKRCLGSVRESDLVGRYGGEELIILMPETDRATAVHIAERLCKSLAGEPIETSSGEITVTVSIGVATKDENTLQLETLIARADQAMYIAKHKGRNCVAISR